MPDCRICINVVGSGLANNQSHACARAMGGNRSGSQRAELSPIGSQFNDELLFMCDGGDNETGAGHIEP